jgi:hypothetical protein
MYNIAVLRSRLLRLLAATPPIVHPHFLSSPVVVCLYSFYLLSFSLCIVELLFEYLSTYIITFSGPVPALLMITHCKSKCSIDVNSDSRRITSGQQLRLPHGMIHGSGTLDVNLPKHLFGFFLVNFMGKRNVFKFNSARVS